MISIAEWIRERGYEAYCNYRKACQLESLEIAETCYKSFKHLRDVALFLDYEGYYEYRERYYTEHDNT